ncbi:hypothetical protein [Sphingobacterium faecium]|nr:hypothetical protein [Sphingobacterium faecium]
MKAYLTFYKRLMVMKAGEVVYLEIRDEVTSNRITIDEANNK